MIRPRLRTVLFSMAILGTVLWGSSLLEVAFFLKNAAFNQNFNEVSAGRFYRSAQMPEDRLSDVIRKYGIKTVIDIRASEAKLEKYGFSEPALVESLTGKYHHLPFIGAALPARNSVLKLIELFDSSEEPILLHDSSGTHRAGTASAIWVLTRQSAGIDEAKKQLSLRYGFFRYERALKSRLQGYSTIDHVIWQYESDFKKTGLDFRQWLASTDALQ